MYKKKNNNSLYNTRARGLIAIDLTPSLDGSMAAGAATIFGAACTTQSSQIVLCMAVATFEAAMASMNFT